MFFPGEKTFCETYGRLKARAEGSEGGEDDGSQASFAILSKFAHTCIETHTHVVSLWLNIIKVIILVILLENMCQFVVLTIGLIGI